MKIIINESQYRILKESKNKKAILAIIDQMGLYGASEFLGIPIYELIEMGVVEKYNGDLVFELTDIKNLGELRHVDGNLNLSWTDIKNLGELRHVGGSLFLYKTKVKKLGNLKYVGEDLIIIATPLSKLSDEKIRSKVEIKGKIYRG
jgi:hypothetical protein